MSNTLIQPIYPDPFGKPTLIEPNLLRLFPADSLLGATSFFPLSHNWEDPFLSPAAEPQPETLPDRDRQPDNLPTNSSLSATDYATVNTPFSLANTSSNLTASSTPQSGSTFNSQSGYGLVDAAAAVAATTGQTIPYPEVANLGGTNWGLEAVNAPEVWNQGYTGKGIIVAVVDSGIDFTHPELQRNLWTNSDEIFANGIDDDSNGYIDDVNGWDFSAGDNDPSDLYGHGTHVAGIIAGVNDGFGVTGVAYDAQIMPIKMLDDAGIGLLQSEIDGIYYAVNNGADIINLSLGRSSSSPYSYSSAEAAAIQYAVQQGVTVVMAAGNEGAIAPGYPAQLASQWGIAVGAVDIYNQVAAYSNAAGSTPSDFVVAPGNGIYSAAPNNTYAENSGTSMAVSYVSGVAALVLSANPLLAPDEVESIITATSDPTGI